MTAPIKASLQNKAGFNSAGATLAQKKRLLGALEIQFRAQEASHAQDYEAGAKQIRAMERAWRWMESQWDLSRAALGTSTLKMRVFEIILVDKFKSLGWK